MLVFMLAWVFGAGDYNIRNLVFTIYVTFLSLYT